MADAVWETRLGVNAQAFPPKLKIAVDDLSSSGRIARRRVFKSSRGRHLGPVG